MAKKIPWIGTSWKMNKIRAEARSFAEVHSRLRPVANTTLAQPFVIPPFPYIAEVARYSYGNAREDWRAEYALGRAGCLDG